MQKLMLCKTSLSTIRDKTIRKDSHRGKALRRDSLKGKAIHRDNTRVKHAHGQTGQAHQATTQHWTTPGLNTGVGPTSYQRSDQQIPDEVCHRLTQHGHLNASNIEVSVRNGIVTPRGSVPSCQAKRMAEDTAESVQRVRDVENHNQDWPSPSM